MYEVSVICISDNRHDYIFDAIELIDRGNDGLQVSFNIKRRNVRVYLSLNTNIKLRRDPSSKSNTDKS